jgi:hypothetical protein
MQGPSVTRHSIEEVAMDIVKDRYGGRKGDEIGSKVIDMALGALCVPQLIGFEELNSARTYILCH